LTLLRCLPACLFLFCGSPLGGVPLLGLLLARLEGKPVAAISHELLQRLEFLACPNGTLPRVGDPGGVVSCPRFSQDAPRGRKILVGLVLALPQRRVRLPQAGVLRIGAHPGYPGGAPLPLFALRFPLRAGRPGRPPTPLTRVTA